MTGKEYIQLSDANFGRKELPGEETIVIDISSPSERFFIEKNNNTAIIDEGLQDTEICHQIVNILVREGYKIEFKPKQTN